MIPSPGQVLYEAARARAEEIVIGRRLEQVLLDADAPPAVMRVFYETMADRWALRVAARRAGELAAADQVHAAMRDLRDAGE